MKQVLIVLLGLVLIGCQGSSDPEPETAGEVTTKRPNIVLFLTDDQGWGDVGFNGNEVIETPTIDQIAQQGVSFKRFYVNPVCSPTRAALLTGRHSLRTGVFSVTRGGEKMRSGEITLAESLKELGYATGLFGKWHNGAQYPHDPNGQGFDEYLGIVDGHQTLYFDSTLMKNGEKVKTKGYIADVTTDAAIDFIRENKEQPFFAYVPFNTPHGPFEVPESYYKKYLNKGLSKLDASIYGMVENLDDNMGRVLATLKELELEKDTIVLFLTDNGPAFPHKNSRYNGGMKGSKGSVDEGGVRVPLFVHWPGQIEGGREIKTMAQHIDLFPTLLSLVGGESPQDRVIDGEDLSPLLLGHQNDAEWPERNIYIHHFRNTVREGQTAVAPSPGAIRASRWLATYQRNEQWYLYDLERDPLQKQDVAASQPQLLERLKADYLAWYADVSKAGAKIIPIEVGHLVRPNVLLNSHEAWLAGDNINYAHKSGWAHDWVVIQPADHDVQMKWPLKVTSAGSYRLEIAYGLATGGKAKISAQVGEKSIRVEEELASFVPSVDEGERRYYTGEAPELTWRSFYLGTLDLEQGVSELKLNFGTAELEDNLLIKSIQLTKI